MCTGEEKKEVWTHFLAIVYQDSEMSGWIFRTFYAYNQYLVNIQAIFKFNHYHQLDSCTKNPLTMNGLLEIIQKRKKFELIIVVISEW